MTLREIRTGTAMPHSGARQHSPPPDHRCRTPLSSPNGALGERGAKITPFKVMRGKQPFDAGTGVIAVPHLSGKGGYWDVFDWNSAVRDGMKAAGVPYAGPVGWVETDMYWKVNHMVVPKAKALGCGDCHGPKGRMDWKALGYGTDPRAAAKKR